MKDHSDFGASLRREREMRGVSLDEISSVTKIHVKYLRALEENDLDLVPGEVFIKGFIRSYAKAIGSDVDEWLSAYDETLGNARQKSIESYAHENEQSSGQLRIVNFMVGGFLILCVVFGVYYLINLQPKEKVFSPPGEERLQKSDDIPESNFLSDDQNIQNLVPPLEDPETFVVPPSVDGSVDQESFSPESLTPDKIIGSSSGQPAVSPEASALPSGSLPENESIGEASLLETKRNTEENAVNFLGNSDIIDPSVQSSVTPTSFQTEESLNEVEPQSDYFWPLGLEIRTKGDAWIKLKVDKARAVDFILPQGSFLHFNADERFTIDMGNRQATELILNGRILTPPAGTGNVVRDYIISKKSIP